MNAVLGMGMRDMAAERVFVEEGVGRLRTWALGPCRRRAAAELKWG